jgi:signal peptidase II
VRDNEDVTADDVRATSEPASGEPAGGRPVRAEAGGRRAGLFAAVALVVLALDVVAKLLVVNRLPESHPPVRLLGGLLYLNQQRNSGAAFSLGTGFTIILTLVALAVVAVIVRTAGRLRSTGWAVSLGLILGGALGNLGDRVFRAPGLGRGHVVDWISVFGSYDRYWPIFNLADSAIVCGAILAALLVLLGVEFDGRKHARG